MWNKRQVKRIFIRLLISFVNKKTVKIVKQINTFLSRKITLHLSQKKKISNQDGLEQKY